MRIVEGDPRAVLGIGVDPFDPALTPARFGEMLRGSRATIKAWLLDQRKLAGIGNIYACEALFYAGIRPTRKAGRKTHMSRSVGAVARAAQSNAKSHIHRGSSVDDYVDAEGKRGRVSEES